MVPVTRAVHLEGIEQGGALVAEDLPKTMSVIAITRPGGPEVLAMEERDVPAPAPGEVNDYRIINF